MWWGFWEDGLFGVLLVWGFFCGLFVWGFLLCLFGFVFVVGWPFVSLVG